LARIRITGTSHDNFVATTPVSIDTREEIF